MRLPEQTLIEIINQLPDSIILMDHNRTIHFLNEAAEKDTGWKIGDKVPYCLYCNKRDVKEGEERCILKCENSVPFFQSHIVVYSSIDQEFEMSIRKIHIDGEEYCILRLRRPVANENSEIANYSRLLVQETMLAQELERKRIARELHDCIGQSIYSIFLGLEGIRYFLNDECYESHLANMVDVMEKTLTNIKRLSKDLRPETVYHLGIRRTLEEIIQDWSKLYHIHIDLECELENEETFCQEKEVHLFRIIQEAVSNAVRHGKASKITIQLKTIQQNVSFKVIDNGTGFSGSSNDSKGLGLKHMYERCRLLEGDIRWTSNQEDLTVVEGYVCLMKKEVGEIHECFDSR